MIHPTAVVSPAARLGLRVSLGPFCVVEAGASIGDDCQLGPHTVVCRDTTLGPRNVVHSFCVLGGRPQHLAAEAHVGGLEIGEGNEFREHVTIHRGLQPGQATTIGDDNYLMVGVHVAHDCQVGDGCVFTNNVLLGGHVSVGSQAYFGGAAAVHQFCRVGRLAMIGGMARLTQDVPPFVLLDGGSCQAVGINRVGLARAGIDGRARRLLKDTYRQAFEGPLGWRDAITSLGKHQHALVREFADFCHENKRGYVTARRQGRSPQEATPSLRVHRAA